MKRLALLVVCLPLLSAGKCSENECDKLSVAVAAACMAEPTSEVCKGLSAEYGQKCSATPTPTTPPPPTTTLPEPPPTTTTTTTTTLPVQPPVSALPESCKSAEVYEGANYWGQGLDSSVRWRGSKECCADLGHANVSSDCHAEGYPQRLAAELEALGGLCTIWQYSVDGKAWARCEDDPNAPLSCDHFGSTTVRDDPDTAAYEGPAECAGQRGRFGPNAGWFVIAHGKGLVRACKPDGTGCSAGRAVDY
jgi:hypothetical protein